jgi:hypothetical protein
VVYFKQIENGERQPYQDGEVGEDGDYVGC